MPITPNDPADFTPTMKGYTGQGAFRFWCQTVLPLVYDDSLSYYELLNKVVVYLNNTISDVANMEDNVSGLYTAYMELQGYVNDYFSTLDVQEEINNKLDAMALNGELSALIAPYVPAAVTEWLAANLYPTEPPVDKTLSIGNAAADSETVGNIFYETTDINNYMNPESRYVVRDGLTIKYLQNGSIFITGQAEATTRYIYAQDIPIGSYKRGRIVIGGSSEGGNFNIEYRTTHSGNWTSWGPNVTLNVAAETYQFCMKIANGMSFTNWNQFFYIYPASGNPPTAVWNRTAIDHVARQNIASTEEDVEGVYNYVNAKLFPISEGNNIISPEAISLTNEGMTFSFDKSGTVWLDGTAGEDGAFYVLINGFTEAGTYTWKFNRIANALTQGSFIIQTSNDNGSTWTRWSANTNYTANIGDLVRINCAANTIANDVGYRFVFWNVNSSEPQEDWAETAIDYYAREFNYKCSDELEGGGMSIVNGFVGHSQPNFYNYRRQQHLVKITESPIKIKINEVDLPYVSSINVFQYTASGDSLSFVSRHILSLVNGVATYHPDPEITHIKATLAITDSTHGFQPIEFFSSTPVYTVANFNTITGTAYKTIEFNYEVAPGVWTKGQLMLPPNYHNEGAKVPLMVYIHGTTRMATWDMVLPGTGSNESDATIWRNLWDYMLNEGFAIFDCYPWTSKYYSASTQYSPMPISIHNSAYTAGIKYVCDRYNVNINQVFAMCKSLGGSYGYMLMEQRDVKVNAIAMMAPSTLFTNPKTLEFFQSVYQRTPLLKYLGLENAEGASTFRTTANGMTNETCVNFVKNNLDLFYPVSYATINAHGAKRDEAIEWILGLTNTKPQWMTDESVPDWSTSVWTHGMSEIVEHPELTKYTKVPVAYWQSWDDDNASTHMAYTAATWLRNGGSNVVWNTVPNNTGKHHSVDNADNAITQSGTTRLGYSYTDVNYVWVECADFFYKYM